MVNIGPCEVSAQEPFTRLTADGSCFLLVDGVIILSFPNSARPGLGGVVRGNRRPRTARVRQERNF